MLGDLGIAGKLLFRVFEAYLNLQPYLYCDATAARSVNYPKSEKETPSFRNKFINGTRTEKKKKKKEV